MVIMLASRWLDWKKLLTPSSHEPGIFLRWLRELGVNVVIAAGLERRAQDIFVTNGIEVVVRGPSDGPESLIQNYLEGTLLIGENLPDH